MQRARRVLAAALFLGAAAGFACGNGYSEGQATPEAGTGTATPSAGRYDYATGAPAPGGTLAAGDAVTVRSFAFEPATLTVSPGTAVTFAVTGGRHTITSDDGGVTFDSGALGTGQAFTFEFRETGTFAYHCEFHASMRGTVMVR